MFTQNNPPHSSVPGYQIRIWLIGIHPIIWRRFLFRSDQTFADLHQAIQIASDWSGDMLYRFKIGGATIGSPQTFGSWTSDSAEITRLSDFIQREGQRFTYEYSIRDDWQIEVRVEKLLWLDSAKIYPCCTGGKRTAPLEQCGGADRFMWLLEQYSPLYINRRMVELCNTLLSDELYLPEYLADIADIQLELSDLRYWLTLEQFDRRAVNRQLRQYATRATKQRVEEACVS